MPTGTTSARWSHNAFVIHGSHGHSVGVMEEPEGSVGYNHVWTIPGEEGTVAVSAALEIVDEMRRAGELPDDAGYQLELVTVHPRQRAVA